MLFRVKHEVPVCTCVLCMAAPGQMMTRTVYIGVAQLTLIYACINIILICQKNSAAKFNTLSTDLLSARYQLEWTTEIGILFQRLVLRLIIVF